MGKLRKKMKQRSRKIKGRRLTNYVRDRILKAFPHLKSKDVSCTENGLPGPDLLMSKVAKQLCPWSFEMKNQEKLKGMYKWYRQASKGAGRLSPAVVCKRNTQDPIVIISFDDFIDLIK